MLIIPTVLFVLYCIGLLLILIGLVAGSYYMVYNVDIAKSNTARKIGHIGAFTTIISIVMFAIWVLTKGI